MIQLTKGAYINPRLIYWMTDYFMEGQYFINIQFMGEKQLLSYQTKEEKDKDLEIILGEDHSNFRHRKNK